MKHTENRETASISRRILLLLQEEALVCADPEEGIADRLRDRTVFEALQKLPQDYRDALYFAYFDGYKISEISAMTGKSRKKVYNLLARAKAALKEILLKEGIGYDDL